jgi:D-sedoheptulose 7-phosphate isomerase
VKRAAGKGAPRSPAPAAGFASLFKDSLLEGAALPLALLLRHRETIERMARVVAQTLARGRTVFFCGNGGSAAEAQHLAAELVGRYRRDRAALPAVALTTDTSILTAVSNDYGFARVFARQVEGLGRRGDLLVALTTSGRSPSILEAVAAARARGMRVIGLTGAEGRAFARRCDAALVVPSRSTPRIQEMHLLVGHLLCEAAEAAAPAPRRAGRRRP